MTKFPSATPNTREILPEEPTVVKYCICIKQQHVFLTSKPPEVMVLVRVRFRVGVSDAITVIQFVPVRAIQVLDFDGNADRLALYTWNCTRTYISANWFMCSPFTVKSDEAVAIKILYVIIW